MQENTQEGGEKKEEPLVDITEPKEENVEDKPQEAEVATEAQEVEAQAEQPKAEENNDAPLVAL